MSRGQLTGGQLFWVAFSAMFPTIVLLLPGDLIRLAGRYAWWTPLLAAVPACAYAWAVGAGAGHFGDLVRANRRWLGPVFGRVFLLTAWVAVGVYVVLVVRQAVDLAAQTFIFRDVPVIVLDFLGLAPAALLAWLGPVVIARMATILGAGTLVTFGALLVASLPRSHLIWVLPLLPRNLRFAHPHPLDLMSIWLVEPAAVGALLMHRVAPGDRRHAARSLAGAVAMAAAASAVSLWVIVATVGPDLAGTVGLPLVSLIRELSFQSVQHLEALVMPLMVIGSAVKLAIFLLIWARLGSGLAGGWHRTALALAAAAGGVLGIALLRSPAEADTALYAWGGLRALPALACAVLLPYGIAAVRQGRTRG